MSKYNYSKLQQTATELLEKYGDSISIIDSTKSILSTASAVRGTLSKNSVPGTITENVDAVFYIPEGTWGLSKRNFLVSQGITYKIVLVEPAQPGDTEMLTKVLVSK